MLLFQKSRRGKLPWLFSLSLALLTQTLGTTAIEVIQCGKCNLSVTGESSTMPCPKLKKCGIHTCGNMNRSATAWRCTCGWYKSKPTGTCNQCGAECACKVSTDSYTKKLSRQASSSHWDWE
ncbi:hypothetical protein PTTG_11707 [Puccinia triticina 1-1 BBBD Race 1]|uniref:TNFR-Cys domain-containing protein n=1 Tax=Puccinia triticina (isolate 1-1 / race 1 (BBBD)) TaxID=630390 RepID=A0A180H5P9_PUCT1|nr:hypothetical protein PTTG_11707 [Puccinia triticina 1-1 BBBD Race 1]WAR53110.1 hypothetical protein PtB15_2B541 [Puccinia triticina]